MAKSLRFKRAAGSALKFVLVDVNDNNRPASYAEFLASLKQDESFRVMLSETMNQQGLKGFYWECVPVSWSTLSLTDFEFVLIPTDFHACADAKHFSEHFKRSQSQENAVTFKNSGRDADLVVPMPPAHGKQAHFVHLAAFLREASQKEKDDLWAKVATTLETRLSNTHHELTWLSTHGKGVPWLHIRLDKKPKYYHCSEFKTASALRVQDNDEVSKDTPIIDAPMHQASSAVEGQTSTQASFLCLFQYSKATTTILASFAVCFIVAAVLLASGVGVPVAATIAFASGGAIGACTFFALTDDPLNEVGSNSQISGRVC